MVICYHKEANPKTQKDQGEAGGKTNSGQTKEESALLNTCINYHLTSTIKPIPGPVSQACNFKLVMAGNEVKHAFTIPLETYKTSEAVQSRSIGKELMCRQS